MSTRATAQGFAVPTARGDTIDPSELGFTLVTENTVGPVSPEFENNWPDLTIAGTPEEKVIADAVAKLNNAKEAGVDTIIDRNIPGIGRYVPRVQKIAQQTELNIIVSTGYYTWQDLPSLFIFRYEYAENLRASGAPIDDEPSLEDFIIRDIEEGILDTGVRAGIIKIVTDRYGITYGVREVIGASARAHRRTGVPITTHTGVGIGTESGLQQQEVLSEEGVDLSRVIIGHVDWTPPEVPIGEFERLLQKGSCLSFDTLGLAGQFPPDWREKRIERVVELCERGYAEQIMLSHDDYVFTDIMPPMPYARNFEPYTEVPLDLIPKLKERGVSDEQVTQMMVGNPRRILESASKGGY